MLVTCDQERYEVHTNFTGTRPLVYSFTLDDLLTAKPTANCARLRNSRSLQTAWSKRGPLRVLARNLASTGAGWRLDAATGDIATATWYGQDWRCSRGRTGGGPD
ncbi:MAG: hypothetical protein WBQ10_15940 [Terriglobales bacterium]